MLGFRARRSPRRWRRDLALAGGLLLSAGAGMIVVMELTDDERRLPFGWQRGMNVTAYSPDAFDSATARSSLAALRETGATHATIVTNWYMEDATASELRSDPERTPTDQSLLDAIGEARSLGMAVGLKPHVDVLDDTFRGDIAPEDREAWFRSYRRMADHYAKLADEAQVTLYVVGTELKSLSDDADAWREVIDGARDRFDGTLTYAANWVDEAERIEFWDDLDVVGIDAYMPLQTGEQSPSVDQLVMAWQPYVQRIEELHDRWDKPVLFTELGYASVTGAAERPFDEGFAEPSEIDQESAYAAAFEVWSRVPWFEGIYWWDWSAEGRNAEADDASYRPARKLAEDVLRDWNGVRPRED